MSTTKRAGSRSSPCGNGDVECEPLARRWYAALAPVGFVPLPPEEVSARFVEWTARLLALARAEADEPGAARAVGAALAELRFIQPEALRETLVVLGTALAGRSPLGHGTRRQTRAAELLGELAAGFVVQLGATILDEQEAIHRVSAAEHQAMEAAVRERETRLRAIFAGVAAGVILVNATSRLLDANPMTERILGYSASELRTLTVADFTHPEDVAESTRRFEELLAGACDAYQIEKRYRRKDGQLRWCHVAMSRVGASAADGERPIVGIIEDVSERRLMEADLREARQRLAAGREAERLRLAQHLHDGPVQDLFGVRFQLGQVGETLCDAAARALLEEAQATVLAVTAHLRSIAGDLHPPALGAFGLGGAIRSHASRLRATHPEMEIALVLTRARTRLPETTLLTMYRIYQEAMANVVRHAGPCGVTIHLRMEGDCLVLSVRDTGRGFGVPFRYIEPLERDHLGLLGMAEMAEAIGAELLVDAAVGSGTCIEARVPVPE